jgi:hypothetical protein
VLTSLMLAAIVILVVAGTSSAIVYGRITQLAEPERLARVGVERARNEETRGFAFLAVMFGVMAALVYVWLVDRFPESAQWVYFVLGLGSAFLLSVIAAVLRPRHHLHGVGALIALNFTWGIGYGGILPEVLTWPG